MPLLPVYSTQNYRRQTNINTAIGAARELQAEIPPKQPETNLLLAWNIRNLIHRPTECGLQNFYYIAEIIFCFDLVAIQSAGRPVGAEKLMRILGSHWRYVTTMLPGNRNKNGWLLYMTPKVNLAVWQEK